MRFELSGFEHARGRALCALYTRPEWLKPGKGRATGAAISGGRAACVFEGVPFGNYALAAFHDQDGDGALDTVFGIPSEPTCFSNRARLRFGPPSFERAKITHEAPRTVTSCRFQ